MLVDPDPDPDPDIPERYMRQKRKKKKIAVFESGCLNVSPLQRGTDHIRLDRIESKENHIISPKAMTGQPNQCSTTDYCYNWQSFRAIAGPHLLTGPIICRWLLPSNQVIFLVRLLLFISPNFYGNFYKLPNSNNKYVNTRKQLASGCK